MTGISRRTVFAQLGHGPATADERVAYPAITSIRGYWWQVGRYGTERLL